VPEVMLHLREMGVLKLDAMTVSGETLARTSTVADLEAPEKLRQHLRSEGIDPIRSS